MLFMKWESFTVTIIPFTVSIIRCNRIFNAMREHNFVKTLEVCFLTPKTSSINYWNVAEMIATVAMVCMWCVNWTTGFKINNRPQSFSRFFLRFSILIQFLWPYHLNVSAKCAWWKVKEKDVLMLTTHYWINNKCCLVLEFKEWWKKKLRITLVRLQQCKMHIPTYDNISLGTYTSSQGSNRKTGVHFTRWLNVNGN